MNTKNQILAELFPNLILGDSGGTPVGKLSQRSGDIGRGDIFVAIKGNKFDGRDFIPQVIEAGAIAVLVESETDSDSVSWYGITPIIALHHLSMRLSELAAKVYRDPSGDLSVIGITGTNGKTTCSILLSQLFALHAGKAGIIGTLGAGVIDAKTLAPLSQQLAALPSTGMTTPDAVRVQQLLAEINCIAPHAVVAMEISSHSLVLGRVTHVQISCAIFTNLTQDHLDQHGNMQAYGQAKQQLLLARGLKTAIINADDPWAAALEVKVPVGVAVIRYSVSDANADIYVRDLTLSASGFVAEVITPWGCGQVTSRLTGRFNVSNMLAVIAAAVTQGISFNDCLALIPQLAPAAGRMQVVELEQSTDAISVIIDYAHTPDALENALKALREHEPANIWTVFGCGGDRDKTKRPMMGRIAERLSDYVVITNDNPRSEEPAAIAADILKGMRNTHGGLVIADRAQAIDLAIQQAKAGDVVLIAGKGHENDQQFADRTVHFSDYQQALLSLQKRVAKLDAHALSGGH